MNRSIAGHAGAALFFCAIACAASLYLGQDINYDLKAYHLHNGWAVMNGRWSQDLFAAGPLTFFSPYLDVPYYLVAAALFPSGGAYVVALAGIPYGVLLFLIYLISGRVASSLELGKRDRAAFVAAAVLVAGTGAATWPEVGATFNDIPVAAIILAAFHQVLVASGTADGKLPPRRLAVAGMLLGLAMGLKLTAAIHVASLGIVILCVAQGWRNKLRSLAILGGCAFAAFAAVYGPWAWKVHSLTGNPFFPLMNGVFRSDWLASINFRDERFLPRSWLQWLFYPFYWTTQQTDLVTERAFRDARMAVAYVALAGFSAIALVRRDARAAMFAAKYRPVHVLALFVTLSYVLWLHQFSILRYLVATECLAGIFIIAGVVVIARRFANRAAWVPAVSVVAVAGAITGYTVYPQWGRAPAGTDILTVEAPQLEPGALVIFADNAMSFLAPGLAATGGGLHFMTIPRWFVAGAAPGVPRVRYELERRMQAKVAEHANSFYVLFEPANGPPKANLELFDIEMEMASCRPGHSAMGVAFLVCRGIHAKERVSPRLR